MVKKFKLPTILGIIILLAGTFAGVFFLNMRQVFRIGASAESSPKDVRISNISGSSATISWVTDKESIGFVKYGVDDSDLKQVASEGETEEGFLTHSINLTGLTPLTPYYFQINSDGSDYDNNGVSWQFKTGSDLSLNSTSLPVSGSIISASGNPTKRALVYLNVAGYLMSTMSSDTGNFVFQLGSARTTNLQAFATIEPNATLLEVSVQSGGGNFSNAQIFPQSANPIPPLVLGQTQDFRNLNPDESTENPDASLNLPNEEESSKFELPQDMATPMSTSVILESLDDGEVISTDSPEFFGKAPQGTNLTITVHSDQLIEDSLTVPKSGSWKWSPPENLSPGSHTITISWLDASGITRSLKRNFVVQAAEAPAFSASSSGTIASPTPTVKPTNTPKATISPKPSSTPNPEATDLPAPVPETGDLTPTLFLFIMSIGILVFSFGVWKLADEKIQ